MIGADDELVDETLPDTTPAPASPPKKRRGFACMAPELVSAIASKGGKAAHAAGTAHQFNTDEARAAGIKGGRAPHKSRGGVRRKAVAP